MRLRFDCGTVVIDEVESGVHSFSAARRSYTAFRSCRRGVLRLARTRSCAADSRTWAHGVADDVEAPVRVDGVRVPGLRWYQREAVDDDRRASPDISRSRRAAGTGSGKTIVAIAAIAALETVTCATDARAARPMGARDCCVVAHAVGKLGDGDTLSGRLRLRRMRAGSRGRRGLAIGSGSWSLRRTTWARGVRSTCSRCSSHQLVSA